MKAGKRIGLFFAGLLCCSNICAQHAWTLEQCIGYALTHNIRVKRQAVALDQQKRTTETSKMSFLPTLDAGASQSFNFGRTASPEDNIYADLNTRNSNFSLSMSVPLTGQIGSVITLAINKLNLKAALEDFEQSREDVALNVTSSVLEVLYRKELYGVAVQQVELGEELYQRTLSLREHGKVTSCQLMETKAQLAQDRASLTEIHNGYRQAVLDLTQLLNLPSPEGFELTPPGMGTDEYVLSLSPDEIYRYAEENHHGLMAENHRLQGYRKNISLMKTAFSPQLSLGMGVNTGYYRISGASTSGFKAQWKNNMNKSIVFTLSIPLFNRLETFHSVRNAGLRAADQQLILDNRKQDLYKEIQHAYYNALASRDKHVANRTSSEATAELLVLLKEQYALGKVSAYELNEVRTKWLKADMERIQARYEYEFNIRITSVPLKLGRIKN